MTQINMALTHVMLAASNLKARMREERGQDLLEYSLFGGLIALAIIGAGLFYQGAIASLATGIGNCIDFDSTSVCDPF